MNTTSVLLCLCTFGLGAGCQQSSPTVRSAARVKPELVMIPLDQVCYYQAQVEEGKERLGGGKMRPDPLSTAAVLSPPAVSAIQFNRYADPARPNELMHEAHVVYRRETTPRWRLSPPTVSDQILIGPQLTDGRGEIKPLASQELESYLQQQRQNVQQQQQLMAHVAEGMKQLAQQQQSLAEEVARLKHQSVPEVDTSVQTERQTANEPKPAADRSLSREESAKSTDAQAPKFTP